MTVSHRHTAESFLNLLLLVVRSGEELSGTEENDLLVVAKTVDQFLGLVTTEDDGEPCSATITDDTLGDFSSVEDYISTLIRARDVNAL